MINKDLIQAGNVKDVSLYFIFLVDPITGERWIPKQTSNKISCLLDEDQVEEMKEQIRENPNYLLGTHSFVNPDYISAMENSLFTEYGVDKLVRENGESCKIHYRLF